MVNIADLKTNSAMSKIECNINIFLLANREYLEHLLCQIYGESN